MKIINSFKKRPDPETLTVKISERLLLKLRKLQEDYGDNSELQVIESLVDEKLREKEFSKAQRKERGSKNQRYISRLIKKKVFRNSKRKCTRCHSGVNLHVDHIRPIKLGGRSSVDNLQVLCFSCNQFKEISANRELPAKEVTRNYQVF